MKVIQKTFTDKRLTELSALEIKRDRKEVY